MFNTSKQLTVSMMSILSSLKSLVLRYIDEEAWAWAGDGEAIAWDVYPLLNLTDDEVSNFATTSCRPTLWAFRALANRLGVSVPQADWAWYNTPEPTAVEKYKRWFSEDFPCMVNGMCVGAKTPKNTKYNSCGICPIVAPEIYKEEELCAVGLIN